MENIYLMALQADKDGGWNTAHELIQHLPSQEAAWIHAYLHRKEGDCWNAQYWYDRAAKPYFDGSLEEEWESLYKSFDK